MTSPDYSQDNPKETPPSPPIGASVSGTIEFKDVRKPTLNVTVYVRVLDTSYADAPSPIVAEQILKGVNIVPGAPPLVFTVHGVPENPKARYVVRVHADVNGDGKVSKGDYISTQSYPVPFVTVTV